MSEETQENPGEEPSMEDILASIRRILSEDGEEEGAEAAPAAADPAPEAPPAEDDMAAAMEEMAAAEEPEAPAEDDMAAAMEAMEAEDPAPAAEEPEEEMDMAAAMENMEAEEPAALAAPAVQVELAEDEPEPAPPPPPAPAPEAPVQATPAPPPAPARPGGEPDISSILDLTKEMITSVPEGSEGLVSTATYRASTDVLGDLARAILGQRELQVGGSDITLEGMVREMMRPLLKEWLDQNLPYLIERLVKKEIDLMINQAERLDS